MVTNKPTHPSPALASELRPAPVAPRAVSRQAEAAGSFRRMGKVSRSKGDQPQTYHDMIERRSTGHARIDEKVPQKIDHKAHYAVNLSEPIEVGGLMMWPGQRVHLLGAVLDKNRDKVEAANLFSHHEPHRLSKEIAAAKKL